MAKKLVDKLIVEEKKRLITSAHLNKAPFPPRDNFFLSRAEMETTTAFKVLREMPKGGVLHVHDEAITSIDWVVKNVTYRPNCYMCVDSSYNVAFHFFSIPPQNTDCPWKLVSEYRRQSMDAEAFDQRLHANLTLLAASRDVHAAYPNSDAAWEEFTAYFRKIEGLMLYAPVFQDYLYEGLRQFREDGVQYLEIRALLPQVYELDGKTHDKATVLGIYKKVINQFVADFPDFTGARIINIAVRYKEKSLMLEDIKQAAALYQSDPGFMVGFDLVGHEDLLYPLSYYFEELLYPYQQNPPIQLPYFFHAGETNWEGTAVDYNLLDAILLGTKRIGHGFSLLKHPLLMEKVKEMNIAVEVNPISNQILKLVDDLRNHPGAVLIANGFPVVISSDDPVVWGALPLTHDFYVTFMTMMGADMGLATLKKLALNSLEYSALSQTEKHDAIHAWKLKWDSFISNTIQKYDLKHLFPVG
ncbi:adenosine deaminase AGSA-like [Pomacea canaliculata]|uniref:adenosine deaminase AGSA-like n=1 Tax=Pomacea canaliculata TaxID=400727 RepID=UPI000D733920|nr:adenosine deaminase AGSA-like [Pomacea canaliculata]